uniref:Vestigial like family member 3 n=1 Tax=Latimeria chalumnae TaxID=7897 RepID=H3B0Z3_LATCH
MSCLDVMYHQAYGAHQYLPTSAAAYTAAYYHHHHHNQQKKLAAYSKMQESTEVASLSKEEDNEKEQPAETEYINSKCVLFTYFQGDIGAVVDEHFSRALSQASSFNPETASLRSKTGTSSVWRAFSPDAPTQRSSFSSSFWSSSYQPPPPPCLGGVHPEFPTATAGTFHSPDSTGWPGHGLHHTAPPPPSVSESWHYPLASQASPAYPHVHDVYSSHLDPRYGTLLMPSVRAARIPAPQGDTAKTNPSTSTTPTSAWTGAFHGTVDIVPGIGFDTGRAVCKQQKKSYFF